MIGRWSSKDTGEVQEEPKGFDAFELKLGDLMRGERATLGKSLLDVQRELRIKAAYIAAIENADPDAFDTPGFIAGYVRSYARYLGMDPDQAFATFCKESGFAVAHGMSAEASVIKKNPLPEARSAARSDAEMFARTSGPLTPMNDGLLSRVEPGAIGSLLVLVGLIGAIGFGGWTVLKEVQRVQVAPVEQTPVVLSDLDPLEGALSGTQDAEDPARAAAGLVAPKVDALDRLYRPQALDVPVLVARDAPIATIDPRSVGNFASAPDQLPSIGVQSATLGASQTDTDLAVAEALGALPNVPMVVEAPQEGVRMVAAFPSWVRVRAADGTVIFEGVMNKGDTWEVPATEEPPTLRTGESGAIYFAMDGGCFGPVGPRGSITSNLPLHQQALAELYEAVDPTQDNALNRMLADLDGSAIDPAVMLALAPCQTP